MDTNVKPIVTVLISAFNAEKYIAETIESVLNQTFKDFELLIVDDGSKDGTYARILEFSDNRIRVIQNEKNEGLTSSLNKGILYSKAKYIARLDADDIALPVRLDKQVKFMEAHPNVGLCGSFSKAFGTEECIFKVPTDDEISVDLCFKNCFIHPSVIIRRSVLDQYKLLYRPFAAEDYDLWCQMSRVTQVRNIPEVLIRYRIHNTQLSNVNNLKIKDSVDKIRINHLNSLFENILNSDDLKLLHTVVINPEIEPEYVKILDVFRKLNHYNDECGVPDGVIFLKRLKKRIVLYQMRATKKYRFNDFVLIMKSHLYLIYEILGYRYATKLLLCTLIAKRRN